MKEKPVPPPEPMPELEILREQVRELTAVKTGAMRGLASGLRTWCGHTDHPTMTALGALIAEKVNWRGEALRHRAAIARVRALRTKLAALAGAAAADPKIYTALNGNDIYADAYWQVCQDLDAALGPPAELATPGETK